MRARTVLRNPRPRRLCRRCSAEDWPGWRGPRGDGTVTDTGFPLNWTATENVKWKARLPGTGHSSPVVWKGKVFVTACVEAEQTRVLLCLDRATGKIALGAGRRSCRSWRRSTQNSYASSTPAADGERVYVTFLDKPQMRVYCYDFAGNMLWEKSPGEFHSQHGFCSPPVLYKDLVIVNGDQDAPDGQTAYIVALDKKTGEERWRIDRPNKLRSYCPPVIVDAAGKKQLVLTGSKCVASYDPDTGKQLWIIDGPTEQFVSSMVLHDGVLFMTAGFPVHWVMAIDPTAPGNVTKTHVLWSKKNEGGYVPSPVAHDGKLFLVDDEGVASCWDVKTGKQYWKERLSGEGPPRVRGGGRRPRLLHRRRRRDVRAEGVARVRGAGEEPARRARLRVPGVLRRRDLPPRGEAPVVHRRRSSE